MDALHNACDVFTTGGYRRLRGRSRGGAKNLALLEKQAAELQRLLHEAQSAVEMLRALEQYLGSRTANGLCDLPAGGLSRVGDG